MSKNPLTSYVRARLHRRLFAWFGLTILLTGVVVGFVMAATGGESWRHDAQRVQTFVAHRFAHAWDEPRERDDLARSIAEDLDVDVRVTDPQDHDLSLYGHPGRHAWRLPIIRNGTLHGYVYLGVDRYHTNPLKVALGLVVAGVMIWAMSGKIARRLSRPFDELARVADEIGAGRFESRVDLPRRHAHGEAIALAASINRMAEKIEKQFRDQRELLAAVSHEIRTPLARIRLLLELLREKGLDDPSMGEIDREVVDMDRLVAELLASSRLEFSALTLTDLDAVAAARRAVEREGLSATLVAIDGDAEALRVRADATLVARALSNLVDNAKAHGGGLTKLRVAKVDGALAFEALDAGPGFTKKEAERMFDPFFRGKARGDEKPSLGLGLALVRRIAEAHGGRAYAEARPEGGARVGFTLPTT